MPDWLAEILNARCPGFLETEKALTPKAVKTTPLHFRLEDWIDDHVFAFAKQEGCFNAITYYAIRDPRYQRAEVCWSGWLRSGREPNQFTTHRLKNGSARRRNVTRLPTLWLGSEVGLAHALLIAQGHEKTAGVRWPRGEHGIELQHCIACSGVVMARQSNP